MVAYNDEKPLVLVSPSSLLNQRVITMLQQKTSGLTLENLVSMDPGLIIYVTNDKVG